MLQFVTMLDVSAIKKEFPIFERRVNGNPLVYLDSASTTQKPKVVLDALVEYYSTMNANIHRGVHTLSEEATAAYEGVRAKVARFVGAREPAEIIFTRNATEALNLVAYTWGEKNIRAGDEIAVSELEHHSNLVTWQELCRRKGAVLRVIPLTSDADEGESSRRAATNNVDSGAQDGAVLGDGNLDVSRLDEFITPKCKLVAVTQMSNVLGTVTPVEEIIASAHKVGAVVVVDGAQGVPHLGADVQKMDCDFFAFSAHKMFGPTGVGVLYGKREHLEKMPPFLFGGEMVKEVDQMKAEWNDLPWKFEAGTPNIADVIAFGKALDFVDGLGFERIRAHDQELVTYARQKLSDFDGVTVYGPAVSGGIVSFTVAGVHPHDVASILNEAGVAVRAGHHCAQPLMQRLHVPATTRMSFSVYNDFADVDSACEALKNVYKIFKF